MLHVCLWAARSSLSQGSSFHHFFFFLEFALSENTWMVMLKNLSITSAITVLQKVFPGVGFFSQSGLLGGGWGDYELKTFELNFPGGWGGGPVPAVRNVLAFLSLGEKRKHCLRG